LEKIEMSDTIKAFSESMFECCASLKDIPFRNGILELPRNVFSECVSIESATLPPSVAVIRSGAFGYCDNLETVVLPAGLKLIEDDAFRNCASLSHIRFADDNPAFFVDDDGCLFARRDDGNLTLIKVPVTARQATIPQTVVQSHSEAFQGCDALEKVYIDCPLVEHPIFVALKTEVVAEIVDTSSEEYQEEAAAKESAEAAAVSDEDIFDDENGGIEESILDDVESQDQDAAEEENDSQTQEAGGSDDLLADILGQNVGSGDGDVSEDEEMESVRIKPEELDDAVARGVQEVDEAAFAARVADAQAHAHDGEGEPKIDDEPQAAEPQEPRFVYGMQSVSECFEVVDEKTLYPDRPEEELDKHEPNELEDITTMVVVTEKVTGQKTVSPALKAFCVELAKKYELKRVYFFGGLGLDNDEFLFGFGKFAMYRNVVYAALASDESGLSKEIKNFGEIAELMSPVSPFQKVTEPDALELEKPFKIYVQDSLDGAASVEVEPTVAAEPDVDLSQAQESDAEEQKKGEGLMVRALRILGELD
ncbi:MAG: leucine-rich repeat protein, partial [Treponema sp.]|nr:leucine-rich repeat protein [Treponema sp.]